jgi:Leucine-rich repeat (LRR) protein
LLGSTVTLDASFNPIAFVSPLVFASNQSSSGAQLSTLVLDISNAPTLGPLPNGTVFDFENSTFSRNNALVVVADNTGLGLSLVTALQNFTGGNLSVSIAGNGIRAVPPQTFAMLSVSLTSIDLSNNTLSDIQELAFRYNFVLTSLDLSDNMLTVLPARLTESLPALQNLNLGGNPIIALPVVSNHVNGNAPNTIRGNFLQCSEYGPTLSNTTCSCLQGLYFSIHCECVTPPMLALCIFC